MTKIKTAQAKSITMRVAIAYAGTAEAPRKPVHATAYRRTEGAITIACADGTSVEVRPTDRVRFTYDVTGARATNQRWCKSEVLNDDGSRVCPEPHLRRVGTDRAATAYCDAMLRYYREHPATAAEIAVMRDRKHTDAINARLGRVLDRPEVTADRSRASVLRARITTYGADSTAVAAAAKDYGMTVAEAISLVEREYDVRVSA
jgi:hypothetical protein